MAEQIAMIPASGNEADVIYVLEQKVEKMKSKGWTVVDLSVGAGAVTMPWWVELTSGLELLIAVGGVVLISFRLAMVFKEWKQK